MDMEIGWWSAQGGRDEQFRPHTTQVYKEAGMCQMSETTRQPVVKV